MDILIRGARPDDAEGVVAILNEIIAAGRYTAFDTPFTAEAETRYMTELPARGIFHVAQAKTNQKIVGFQTLDPFATYTHVFDHVGVIATYVDLDRRRCGVGTQLCEATFAFARQKSYEKIFTYVRADNPAALAAYGQWGFHVVGTARKHAKIQGRYVDEVIIERQISDVAGARG
jgi:L-amino acid N-acyltransferase YncA